MPTKNSIKSYVEDGYYHIYNRGVEKRKIFQSQQDYAVFLSYLIEYLMPKNEKELYKRLADPAISYKEKANIIRALRMNNFAEEIILLTYCLMPNHFHFLLKQKHAGSIDTFMNSLATRYTMYFNKKYKRVGPLYQDVYKAVLVGSEEQFLHLSRYIHRNPLNVNALRNRTKEAVLMSQPSSYGEYLGLRNTAWIHPQEILSYFSKINPALSYPSFVEQQDDIERIEKVSIDLDDH
ncbi:MAG: transposase [Candidatus Levybacteria bacterium]|nr:transposase [Candidatus Levybacteria bacterium]